MSYRDSRFQRPNPSITKRLLLARGHHCPHGAHRLCCLRPLLWPRNLASEELLLLLRVRTAIAMIMEEATTTSKQRKSNFLNPKGFPKKVLKDSLRTFQKEKIFALLLLTGLLKAPNSPLFPPGEYAKRCYIEALASIWPNPKAQTIKCPKRTVHGTHYYKSRECKNLRLSFQAFQVVCTTFEVPTQKVSIS